MPSELEAPEATALIHRDPTGPHPTGEETRKLLLALGRYLSTHPDGTNAHAVMATAALMAGDHGAAAQLAGSRPVAPKGVSNSEEWVRAGREWYDHLFSLIERRENILDPIVDRVRASLAPLLEGAKGRGEAQIALGPPGPSRKAVFDRQCIEPGSSEAPWRSHQSGT